MVWLGRFVRYAGMVGAFVWMTGCREDYQLYEMAPA